jgi:hypothetical protein
MTSVQSSLAALALRLAVFAGALTALISVGFQVPVRIACLRGACAWAGTLFVGVLARGLLQHSLRADRARARERGGQA